MHQLTWASCLGGIHWLQAKGVAAACVTLSLTVPLAWAADRPAEQARNDWRAQLEDCDAYSQAEMRLCLATKAQQSEQALQQAESSLANAIEHWDEDPKHLRAARAQLRSAGQEFFRYRRAQCALNTALGGGAIGNALEMRRLRCLVEVNSMRADQLQRMARAMPQK